MTSIIQIKPRATHLAALFAKRAFHPAGYANSLGKTMHGAATSMAKPFAPGAPATPPTPAIPSTGGANLAPQAAPNPSRSRPVSSIPGAPGGFGGMGQTGTPGTGSWSTGQIDAAASGLKPDGTSSLNTQPRQGTFDALAGRNYTDYNRAGTSGTMMSKQPGGGYTPTASINRQLDANGQQTGAQIKSQYGTGSATTIPTKGTDAYKTWANNRSFTNDQGQKFTGPDAMQRGVQGIANSVTSKAQDAAGAAARAANPQGWANANNAQLDQQGADLKAMYGPGMGPGGIDKSPFQVALEAGMITPQQQASIAAAGKTNMPAAPNPNAPNTSDPFQTAPAVGGAPPPPAVAGATPPATTPATGAPPPVAPPTPTPGVTATPPGAGAAPPVPPPPVTPPPPAVAGVTPPATTPTTGQTPPTAPPSPAAVAGANQLAAANPGAFHGSVTPVGPAPSAPAPAGPFSPGDAPGTTVAKPPTGGTPFEDFNPANTTGIIGGNLDT